MKTRCGGMKAEQIQEMFPAKNEQIAAQRIIETLKNLPDSNALQISDLMSPQKSPSARIADSNGLYHVLKGLQALGAVTCRINPIGASFLIQDHFSLNLASEKALSALQRLDEAKRRSPIGSGQARYILFVCSNCGAVIGARSSQKSATCTICNHRNKIGEACNVLLRTDSCLELQSAIQQAKKHRLSSNKMLQKSTPNVNET